MELTSNTILITGGTSGLGLEFARRMLALGNTVIVTGRDQARLESMKRQFPAIHIFQSDISDPEAIRSLYEKVIASFPDLNMLINNAGEMRVISLHDKAIGLLDITREIEINLMGPIRMIQQFLPHLKLSESAAILNVTSGLALIPFPISPIYGATKAGLRSYTKSLRVQLKNTKIKVFELVAPAAKTPLSDKFAGLSDYDANMMIAPDKLIDTAIKGLQNDKLEIYPGAARIILALSRIAPELIFKQLSKVGANLMAG